MRIKFTRVCRTGQVVALETPPNGCYPVFAHVGGGGGCNCGGGGGDDGYGLGPV